MDNAICSAIMSLAIRPEEAVIAPAARVLGLSASQISRRIRAATCMAGLGHGFTGHSPRAGIAHDLSAAGGIAGVHDCRAVGQPHHAGKVHRGSAGRQGVVFRYYRGDLRKCGLSACNWWETALGVGPVIGKPRPEKAARLQWWEIPAPEMLPMTTPSDSVEIYCLTCRAKTPSRDVESVIMKNGRTALKGVCAECGTGKYRIGSMS